MAMIVPTNLILLHAETPKLQGVWRVNIYPLEEAGAMDQSGR